MGPQSCNRKCNTRLVIDGCNPLPAHSIPITAYYDGVAQRSRIESFGGMDSVLTVQGDQYAIHPRIDRLKCWAQAGNGQHQAQIKPVRSMQHFAHASSMQAACYSISSIDLYVLSPGAAGHP